MPPDKLDTIVIGGGIAGLSAALHLVERGVKPLIVEADQRMGGRLAARDEIEIDGWRFELEHGVHGIWSPYRNFQAMLARHNLRPVLVPAQQELWVHRDAAGVRSAQIGSVLRHSFLPAPFHYLELFLRPAFLSVIDARDWFKLLDVWSLLVMVMAVDPFAENQSFEGQVLGDYLDRWTLTLRALFIGLARNGLPAHVDQVSLAGFIAFLRFYTVMRRDAWTFSYLPEQGGASVCQPLSERVRALGAQFKFDTRVTRLEKTVEGWRVEVITENQPACLYATEIILATDSPAAEKIIKASFPQEARTLFFPRGMANAVVRVWFDREPAPGAEAGMLTGAFTAHNFFWLHRIYAPYRRWHQATGGSALEMHIYGPPEVLAQTDALLLANVITDLHQAYPELRGHKLGQHLQRNPATHTLPALGRRGTHLGIETPWENLYCAGDWVQDPLPAFFLERACATGLKAANAVLTRRGLAPWSLVPYLPPEPLAAWIESLLVKGRYRERQRRKKTDRR